MIHPVRAIACDGAGEQVLTVTDVLAICLIRPIFGECG